MIKTLRIQLTNECNLRCFYCCHEGTANEFSILTDKNLINFIRASYDVLKIQKVKFTGGEPLEYDGRIYNIINKVDRSDIDYSIVTNGTNYSKLLDLVNTVPNIEVTISIPVPPYNKFFNIYKKITGCIDQQSTFRNVISSIEYLNDHRIRFKINYVLCNNVNTSSDHLEKILLFAMKNKNIQLRFLEMAINSTNSEKGKLNQYIFSKANFEQALSDLGYIYSIIDERRSCTLYDVNGCQIKFIKFFCDNDCSSCPEDKTTLWLTSTGLIKDCSFRSISTPIENWQYPRMAKLLENYIAL